MPASRNASSPDLTGPVAAGDPRDPARARLGAWTIYLAPIVVLAVIVGGIFQVGPYVWGQALSDRLFGRDSTTLAMLPAVALLWWLPVAVLRRLPRRPERSFLCGMQDAIDPRRNPDWASRRPSLDEQERRYRAKRRYALAAALVIPLLGAVTYVIVDRMPDTGGAPLPRMTLAALRATATDALPRYARIVDGVPDTGHVWVRHWRNSTSTYRDHYLALHAAGRSRQGPATVILLASYPASGADWKVDPPMSPIEGKVTRVRLPHWQRARMRDAGFDPAREVVLVERRKLDGRWPGPDGVAQVLVTIASGVLTIAALMVALASSLALRTIATSRG